MSRDQARHRFRLLHRQQMSCIRQRDQPYIGEVRHHEAALRVGSQIGVVRSGDDQRRRLQDPNPFRPVLAAASIQPRQLGCTIDAQDVGHRLFIHGRVQFRADILVDVMPRLGSTRLRITREPAHHRLPVALVHRLRARWGTGQQHEPREPVQSFLPIFSTTRQHGRDFRTHAVSHQHPPSWCLGTNDVSYQFSHFRHRIARRPRCPTETGQIDRQAPERFRQPADRLPPLLGTSAEEVEKDQSRAIRAEAFGWKHAVCL